MSGAAYPEEPEEIPTIKPTAEIYCHDVEPAVHILFPGFSIGKGLAAHHLGWLTEMGYTHIISFSDLLSPASLDRLLLGEADFEEREWLQLRTALLNFLVFYQKAGQAGGRLLVLNCPVALLLTFALLVYQGYAEHDLVRTVLELRQGMGVHCPHPNILRLLLDWRTETALWAEAVRQAAPFYGEFSTAENGNKGSTPQTPYEEHPIVDYGLEQDPVYSDLGLGGSEEEPFDARKAFREAFNI